VFNLTRRPVRSAVYGIAISTVLALPGISTPVAAAESPVSFSREIAPILLAKCDTCHNTQKAKGGYRIETFELIMQGGKSKEPSIVPKKPEQSRLYKLLTAADSDDRMPKKDEPLPQNQIALFKRWIEEGAVCDRATKSERLSDFAITSEPVKTPKRYPFSAPILALAFDHTGSELAASGYGEITFWDAASGKLIRRLGDLPARIQAISFNADGSKLVVAGGSPGHSGEVALFDLPLTAGAKKRVIATSTDLVLDARFSPDGQRLATGGSDNSIRVYDTATGREQLQIQQHADWVLGIAFSHDGKRIISASRDRTCRIFDAVTGELEATYVGHESPVQTVVFGTNDKIVYSGGRDGNIHIWEAKEAKKKNEISESEGEIFKLVFETERLFSCGADKVVRQYDANGKLEAKYSGHKDWV